MSGDLVRRLGVAATVLGATAAVAGSPYAAQRATIDVTALARAVEHEDDHVSAIELAGWIMDRRPHLRVVDVRPQADYELFHIPTAERVSLDSLPTADFRTDDIVVLYSEAGAHAAQGWVFLRALGIEKVYFLRGGLYEWIDQVMSPTLPVNAPKADSAAFALAAPISRYFGGVPRTGVPAATDDAIQLPVKSGDKSTAVAVAKIRRRGC